MIRRGSSVSNDAQDFDLAMTVRALRSNFGLSRLFLFLFFLTKRRKAARISENKNKKQKNKNKFRCKVKREERSLHKLKNSVW